MQGVGNLKKLVENWIFKSLMTVFRYNQEKQKPALSKSKFEREEVIMERANKSSENELIQNEKITIAFMNNRIIKFVALEIFSNQSPIARTKFFSVSWVYPTLLRHSSSYCSTEKDPATYSKIKKVCFLAKN